MHNIFQALYTDGSAATFPDFILIVLTALALGLAFALLYRKKESCSRGFALALSLLPAVVATVILMVNGNIGTGIAVAGAFSLVRFRSAAGRARDISAIFLVMTAGLACAAGYVAIAVLFSLVASGVMLLLSRVPMSCDRFAALHITVPESLHFADAFDDLFDKYTKSRKLVRAKTSNMGSLYKLDYKIEMKDPSAVQEFLDELRCRNGNLEIAVLNNAEGGEEL